MFSAYARQSLPGQKRSNKIENDVSTHKSNKSRINNQKSVDLTTLVPNIQLTNLKKIIPTASSKGSKRLFPTHKKFKNYTRNENRDPAPFAANISVPNELVEMSQLSMDSTRSSFHQNRFSVNKSVSFFDKQEEISIPPSMGSSSQPSQSYLEGVEQPSKTSQDCASSLSQASKSSCNKPKRLSSISLLDKALLLGECIPNLDREPKPTHVFKPSTFEKSISVNLFSSRDKTKGYKIESLSNKKSSPQDNMSTYTSIDGFNIETIQQVVKSIVLEELKLRVSSQLNGWSDKVDEFEDKLSKFEKERTNDGHSDQKQVEFLALLEEKKAEYQALFKEKEDQLSAMTQVIQEEQKKFHERAVNTAARNAKQIKLLDDKVSESRDRILAMSSLLQKLEATRGRITDVAFKALRTVEDARSNMIESAIPFFQKPIQQLLERVIENQTPTVDIKITHDSPTPDKSRTSELRHKKNTRKQRLGPTKNVEAIASVDIKPSKTSTTSLPTPTQASPAFQKSPAVWHFTSPGSKSCITPCDKGQHALSQSDRSPLAVVPSKKRGPKTAKRGRHKKARSVFGNSRSHIVLDDFDGFSF